MGHLNIRTFHVINESQHRCWKFVLAHKSSSTVGYNLQIRPVGTQRLSDLSRIIHLIVGTNLRSTARALLGQLVLLPRAAEVMLARRHQNDWLIERTPWSQDRRTPTNDLARSAQRREEQKNAEPPKYCLLSLRKQRAEPPQTLYRYKQQPPRQALAFPLED